MEGSLPSNAATGVALSPSAIEIHFDASIKARPGHSVFIVRASDGIAVAEFDAGIAVIDDRAGSPDSVLQFSIRVGQELAAPLDPQTEYVITAEAGVAEDASDSTSLSPAITFGSSGAPKFTTTTLPGCSNWLSAVDAISAGTYEAMDSTRANCDFTSPGAAMTLVGYATATSAQSSALLPGTLNVENLATGVTAFNASDRTGGATEEADLGLARGAIGLMISGSGAKSAVGLHGSASYEHAYMVQYPSRAVGANGPTLVRSTSASSSVACFGFDWTTVSCIATSAETGSCVNNLLPPRMQVQGSTMTVQGGDGYGAVARISSTTALCDWTPSAAGVAALYAGADTGATSAIYRAPGGTTFGRGFGSVGVWTAGEAPLQSCRAHLDAATGDQMVAWYLLPGGGAPRPNGKVMDYSGRGFDLPALSEYKYSSTSGGFVFKSSTTTAVAGAAQAAANSDPVPFEGDQAFSFCAWFRYDGNQGGSQWPSSLGFAPILGLRAYSGIQTNQGLLFGAFKGGRPGVDFRGTRVLSRDGATVGEWTHACVTRTPSSKKLESTRVYING